MKTTVRSSVTAPACVLLLVAACSDGNSQAPSTSASGGDTTHPEGVGGGNAVGGSESSSGGSAAGGSGATAGSGTGGNSAGELTGQHCAEGDLYDAPDYGGIRTPCFGDSFAFDLPNPTNTSIASIALPAPLTAGQPAALSFAITGYGALSYELWGADGSCGKVQELLWVADFEEKIFCAEFTPTRSYEHVFFVLRRLDNDNSLSAVSSIGICPSGSCAEPNGTGRAAGTTLIASQSAYSGSAGQLYKGYTATLGVRGRMILLGEARTPPGTPMPVTTGIFRAPTPFEPYGDAYYCAGEGTTLVAHGPAQGYDFSLRNITRLGDCAEMLGTGTLTASVVGFEGTLTSSSDPLIFTESPISGLVGGQLGSWLFADRPRFGWVEWMTTVPMGNMETTPLDSLAVFLQRTDTSPLELACGKQGEIYYDPNGESTLTVEDLGALVACPGTPIEDSSWDIHLY